MGPQGVRGVTGPLLQVLGEAQLRAQGSAGADGVRLGPFRGEDAQRRLQDDLRLRQRGEYEAVVVGNREQRAVHAKPFE
jgi:hypothetical protein